MSETIERDSEATRDEWIETVRSFCEETAEWSRAQGWEVAWKDAEVTEALLGTYNVPLLIIQTKRGAVMLEPVARCVMGANGRIDLYAYPTLYRVMLLRSARDGRWLIRTDSGIFIKQPWNEETFVSLANDLSVAPDEPPAD